MLLNTHTHTHTHTRSPCSAAPAPIEVNDNNLAYLTALFPQSEIMRHQLSDQRLRLKPGSSLFFEKARPQRSYSILLSTAVIPDEKTQVLFLLTLVSAFIRKCCIRFYMTYMCQCDYVYSITSRYVYSIKVAVATLFTVVASTITEYILFWGDANIEVCCQNNN